MLKISHRLLAAHCVAAIVDRGRLLHGGYRPKLRFVVRCLRVKHDAPDNFARVVAHIVIDNRLPLATTAFASGDQNKLILAGASFRQHNKKPATDGPLRAKGLQQANEGSACFLVSNPPRRFFEDVLPNDRKTEKFRGQVGLDPSQSHNPL